MKPGRPDHIYTKLPVLVLLGVSISCIFLGFFLNFSLQSKILTFVQTQLTRYSPCTLKYEGPEILYFFPGVQFKNLEIPRNCFNNYPNPLKFDHLNIQINGFDFAIFSPVVSFIGKGQKDFSIQGEAAYSGQDLQLNLKETQINARLLSKTFIDLLSPNIPFPILLDGNLTINAAIQLQKGALRKLKLKIASGDFKIPDLYLMGVEIPEIDIGNLQIAVKTTTDKKKLIFEQVSLGGKENSLTATLDGHINLSLHDFSASQIMAKTKFKIAPDLLEKIPILEVLLKKFYHKDDGFYHVNISHTLESMIFQPGK